MQRFRGLGVLLVIIGIGSFILPMIGYQFTLISIFGKNSEAIVGIIAIVIGVLLLAASFMSGGARSGAGGGGGGKSGPGNPPPAQPPQQ